MEPLYKLIAHVVAEEQPTLQPTLEEVSDPRVLAVSLGQENPVVDRPLGIVFLMQAFVRT